MARTYIQGKYTPKNPQKYRGDIDEIFFRSSWERKFMIWVDTEKAVIEWGSEIAVIPYTSPIDNRIHRYYVDFYLKVQNKFGTTQKYLVEIKPYQQTKPPEPSKKQTKTYINEVMQWGVNEAKWKAATNFCQDRGWKFTILTEHDLHV